MNKTGGVLLDDEQLRHLMTLFAWLLKSEDTEGVLEIGYVYDFFARMYPEDRLSEIYSDFQGQLAGSVNITALMDDIEEDFEYRDKVLLLLLVSEIIVADRTISEHERNIFSFLATELNLEGKDLDFIRCIFGVGATCGIEGFRDDVLSIGGSELDDVLIIDSEASIHIYRIYNNYLVRNNSQAGVEVVIGSVTATPGRVYMLHEGGAIRLPSYVVHFEDVPTYFRDRDENLHKTIMLRLGDGGFRRVDGASECQIWIDVDKTRMSLSVMSPGVFIEVNGRPIAAGVSVPINFRDVIIVNHYSRLDPISLYREEAIGDGLIPLEEGYRAFIISGSQPNADVFIEDPKFRSLDLQVIQQSGRFYLEIRQSPAPIFLNENMINEKKVLLRSGDVLTFEDHVIDCDFEHKALRHWRLDIYSFEASHVNYSFPRSTAGLDDVNFKAHEGQFIAVMGGSGSGKTTLLNALNGSIAPERGEVLINGFSLHENYRKVRPLIGYVPQDEILFENLTVAENLYYAGRLRMPGMPRERLHQLIDTILIDLNLAHRRNSIVGSVVDKVLSGGERKRVNIAIELLTDPCIFLLDEPTTGLSSRDSEQIVSILNRIARRKKIVIATIHQPGSRVFKMFDQLLLLDQGGKMIYYGDPMAAIRYFREHEGDIEESVECPVCNSCTPEYIFDVVERPMKDLEGRPIYEEKVKRVVTPRRVYAPEYWKNLYKTHAMKSRREEEQPEEAKEREREAFKKVVERAAVEHHARGQFVTLFMRNFMTKIRDRSNLAITFIGAPLLSFLVSFVLRYNPDGPYTFAQNPLYPIAVYLFILIAIFFSMTNSVDDIIRDRASIMRERMIALRSYNYLMAKLLCLLIFALIQNLLMLAIGSVLLEFQGMFWYFLAYLMVTSLFGLLLGLFISSILRSSRTAANLIPLVLVPQIIFGGALLQFEKMNRELTIFKDNPIPEIAQVMPSRWAFEGMMVVQATRNPYSIDLDKNKQQKLDLVDLKEKGVPESEIRQRRAQLRDEQSQILETRDLYENEPIADIVFKASGESRNNQKNVFLSRYKFLFGKEYDTIWFDMIVLLLCTGAVFAATILKLHFTFR